MGVEAAEAQALIQPKATVPFKLAYKFVLIFLIVYFARPEDWLPGVHFLHLAKNAGIFAMLAFLAELGGAPRRWPRECIYLWLLLGQMFLTVPFSPIWKGGAFQTTKDFADVVPMILVICLVVNTLPRLRRILFWQVASVIVIAAVAVVKFRHAGGRLEGVLNGNYSNPNDFALTVVMALPMCLAFMLRTRNIVVKVTWLLCIAVMTYSVVLSASRSGMLALCLAMIVALWYFSVKGRYRYLLAMFGAMALCALLVGGSGLRTRFAAIFNPAIDETAYESAQQRHMLLDKSVALTFEHPIFGLGPGNFTVASGAWRVTHNTYTQMSSEVGLPGFILYMLILWCAWRNAYRAIHMTEKHSELRLFAVAILASLAGFLLGSFFASEGYQYFTYFLVAYTTAAYQVAKMQKQTMMVAPRPKEPAYGEDVLGEEARETAWSF